MLAILADATLACRRMDRGSATFPDRSRMVGDTSITAADCCIRKDHGRLARDPGASLTEHMYNMPTDM